MTEITYTTDKPDPGQYLALFNTTGWNDKYKATVDQLASALNKSWYTVSACDGGELVGFGRLVSDGVLYAMIYDMIVLPTYQQQGIATQILLRLLDQCERHDIRDIQLFSARGKQPFYEKRGFACRPEDASGMVYCQDSD